MAAWKIEDQSWGMVQIQQWLGLHFRACATHPMHILRITVAGKHSGKRSPKPMWVMLVGRTNAIVGADMATLPPLVRSRSLESVC